MADGIAEYVLRARDDASAVFQKVTGQAGDLRQAMLTLSTAAGPLGLLATAAAGVGAAIAASGLQFAGQVEQMDRLKTNTGVSIDKLQVMQRVIRDGGGDVESLSMSLIRLNNAISDGNPLLAGIGVTSKDTFTAYMQLAKALTESTDAKARDKVATQLLGRAGGELIADLVNLQEQFAGTYQSMEKVGSLMKGPALQAARDLDKSADDLHDSWEDLALIFQKSVIPGLAASVNLLAGIVNQLSGVESMTDRIKGQLSGQFEKLSPPEQVQKLLDMIVNERTWLSAHPGDQKALENIAAFQAAIDEIVNGTTKAEAGPAANDRLAAALAALNVKTAPSPLLNFGMGPETAFESMRKRIVSGGFDFSQLTGGAPGSELQTFTSSSEINKAIKAMKDLADEAARLKESMRPLNVALRNLRQSASDDLKGTVHDVVMGIESIDDAFRNLIRRLLEDIANQAVDLGVNALFSLIPVPGGGAHAVAATPVGGATYIISTLNAKDLIQDLTSPTGQLRQANDRIRDVALAQAR